MASFGYDYLQDGEPLNAEVWETWLHETTGNFSVKLPGGAWLLLGNWRKENMGYVPSTGGVVDAEITGAHGHAPLADADILEALRVNGVEVVTETDLQAWGDRIKAEITTLLNLQAAASEASGGTGEGETLLGMIHWKSGSIAIKHGKTFNFADPGGPGGDLRPTFSDSSKPDWSNCVVIAHIEALAQPLDGGGGSDSDVFIPASYQDNWNMDYPTGVYIQWQSRNPPVLKAHCYEQSGKGNTHLGVGFTVIGRR